MNSVFIYVIWVLSNELESRPASKFGPASSTRFAPTVGIIQLSVRTFAVRPAK